MNSDSNKELREQLEVRIVAMLLGEASAFEVDELQRLMADDPTLEAFHDQMKSTIGLAQEAGKKNAANAPSTAAQPKLSAERKKVLFAHFQQPKEKILPLPERPKKETTETRKIRRGWADWMIWAGAAACVVVMAGMLLPSLAKSKAKSQTIAMRNAKRQAELEAQMNASAYTAHEDAADMKQVDGNKGAWGLKRHASVAPASEPLPVATPALRPPPPATSVFLPAPAERDALTSVDTTVTDNIAVKTFTATLAAKNGNPAPSTDGETVTISLGEVNAAPTWQYKDGFAKSKSSGHVGSQKEHWFRLNTVNPPTSSENNDFFFSQSPSTQGISLSFVTKTNQLGLDSRKNDMFYMYSQARTANDQSGGAAAGTDVSFFSENKSVTGHFLGGDPEWIGALQQPEPTHSTTNRFVGRYAGTTSGSSNLRAFYDDNFLTTGKATASLADSSSEIPAATPEDAERLASILKAEEESLRRQKSRALASNERPSLDAWAKTEAAKPARELRTQPVQPADKDQLSGRKEDAVRRQEARQQIDAPIKKPSTPPATPQPEILTRENAFSTFSLNVSDVSFKLAAASLQNNTIPDAGSIRVEEFINAFNYRDPAPAPGARLAFAWERARYPFAHNRDIVRFSVQTAARGRDAQKPLNLVILLDNSGSMERADRVAIVHEALRVLAQELRPQDRISVIGFSRSARLWVDGLAGGDPQALLSKVLNLNPEGGTNLEEAMALGYATAKRHFTLAGINRVILFTDGAANLGNVEPEELKKKVVEERQKGIALDCFGIGWEGYNDDLLETLSRNGDGRYGFLNRPEQAAPEFANQLAGALNVAASDVKTQVEFNPNRVTSWRQIGYAKHQLTKEQFHDNKVDAAEIAAAEQGNALYVIETNPDGFGPIGVVRVRFKAPDTGEYLEQEWPLEYQPRPTALDQASAAMRLAVAASAFGEWLSASPFAAEVTLPALQNLLHGVPEHFSPDSRPQQLTEMIRQARTITGK